MRRALFATAAMNVVAAAGFLPGASAVRALAGLPPGENAVYLTTVALFVFLFGVGYFCVAWANRPERLFVAVATAGKLGFFSLLVGFWAAGSLPLAAPLAGSPDLAFGLLFLTWLSTTRGEAARR
jgi:hypothetical protein